MKRRALWLGLGVTLWACASSSTQGGMKARAAQDWQCSESSIRVTSEGRNTYRVTGCGQSALYVCSSGAPTPGGAPPQGSLITEEEYRYQGAAEECHKTSDD